MTSLRPRSARAEKAVRLVTASIVSLPLGIVAVVRDSEAFAYAVMGVLLVAIVAGPLVARRVIRSG
jgi:hypothetical protein